MNETEKPSYYAVIPANIRYCKELKYPERLFYGEITCLLNKEGYCFASNKYFADLYGVIPGTISRWISHLQQLGFITVEVIRDEKKQIIERKIFIKEHGNRQSELYTYKQNCSYPYKQNSSYPISKKDKGNNINIMIDRFFNLIINNNGKIPKDFEKIEDFQEFYKIIERLEFNYTKEILMTFKKENIDKLKIIIYTIKELFIKNKRKLLEKSKRENFIDVYDSCKSFEKTYKDTENEIKSFFDYYYASIIRKLEAK